MHGARAAIGTVLVMAVAAVPAAAGTNANPKVVSAVPAVGADRMVSVEVVGRDADDVVRGAEIEWGAGQPAQGLSACELTSRRSDARRRGRRARFVLSNVYPAAGDYTISVRVTSGGCGRRPQQRSAPRTLTVHLD